MYDLISKLKSFSLSTVHRTCPLGIENSGYSEIVIKPPV